MTPERLPTSKHRATDRRNPRDGRIARLPVSIRTQVNEKLRDNVRGPEIMEWLKKTYPGEYKKAGFGNQALKSLNAWRHGGCREWVRRQHRLEDRAVER